MSAIYILQLVVMMYRYKNTGQCPQHLWPWVLSVGWRGVYSLTPGHQCVYIVISTARVLRNPHAGNIEALGS